MARVVEEEFSFRKSNHRYPWDQWTNGKRWEVVQGEDFSSTLASFISYLHSYAKKHELKVQTRSFKSENAAGKDRVVFQFVKQKTRKMRRRASR